MPASAYVFYEIVWGVSRNYGWGVGLKSDQVPESAEGMAEWLRLTLEYAQSLYAKRQREEAVRAIMHPKMAAYLDTPPDIEIVLDERVGQDYLVFVTGKSIEGENTTSETEK